MKLRHSEFKFLSVLKLLNEIEDILGQNINYLAHFQFFLRLKSRTLFLNRLIQINKGIIVKNLKKIMFSVKILGNFSIFFK